MRDHSGFGWLALIVSILLVLLGIATFIWPEAALESFVMVYGVLAVATGIMDIVFYARVERHTGFGPMTALVSGILSVMCGFMLLVYPSAVGVLIVHRGEVGDADDERAFLLDVFEIGAGGRLFFPAAHQHGGDEGERKRGSGKSGKTVHSEFLQDGRPCRKFIVLI